MACNGCTSRFGFFLKENGCPCCKYSFCSKCLKYRIKIEGKAKDVCLRCYGLSKNASDTTPTNKVSNESANNTSILDVPVEVIPSAKDIINPVATVKEVPSNTSDAEIRNRLAALKRKDDDEDTNQNLEASSSAGTSLTAMEKRLAALKGIEYKDYTEPNRKFLQQKDGRSEEEQIQDLMKQFAEEQEIHESMDHYRLAAIDDIEKRLSVLKDVPATDNSGNREPNKEKDQRIPDSSDDEVEENDEEAANKLAARFLEEAAIDAKKHPLKDEEDELNNLDIPTPLDPSETEELPWCTICNEDAVIRCVSCGGDLFCRGCFKECHDDDEDYRKHEIKPFKAAEKNKS